MNKNTVKQELNEYLALGKINFYQLCCIVREVEQSKLMKDLTPQEKELINQYLKQ